MLSWNKKVGAVNLGEEAGILPKTRVVLQGMPEVRVAIIFKLLRKRREGTRIKVEHFKIWIEIGNPYVFGFWECKKLRVSLANLPFLDLVKEGECVLVVCEGSLWGL